MAVTGRPLGDCQAAARRPPGVVVFILSLFSYFFNCAFMDITGNYSSFLCD
ncbi:hypothetical protein CLOSTASPAR_05226 [[Clostridium] asparagiforme DSM 15981]|uniref:Uncharacterized protein n=1 Tax=[Clostridium] asparagiforme DSM 15981 TaxID=518636 RepID=C0D7H9_9FIRM|nr:hypothetical protein CLOSTASPAR_05226 [[Clostridium] asparagiforme DSM 15981]